MELLKLLENHVQVSYEFYYSKDIGMGPKAYPVSPGYFCFFRDITAKSFLSIVLGFYPPARLLR